MIIVLNAVNLPVEDISLLLAVDWFLDRFRTAANVSGDTIGAAVVEKLCQRHLPPVITTTTTPNLAGSDAFSLSQSPIDGASICTNNNDPSLNGGEGSAERSKEENSKDAESLSERGLVIMEEGGVKSTKF